MELVLASGSPRRRELLSLIKKDFLVFPAEIEETLVPGAPFSEEVVRLSRLKAQAAQAQYPEAACIGSDTLVVVDDQALGKPADREQAETMLRLLCGRTHTVLTGLAVLLPGGEEQTLYTETTVTFCSFGEEELAAYLATGEPMDKAGAYGIQGYGALFIDSIQGDYYSVMGLPVSRLYAILRRIAPQLDGKPATAS